VVEGGHRRAQAVLTPRRGMWLLVVCAVHRGRAALRLTQALAIKDHATGYSDGDGDPRGGSTTPPIISHRGTICGGGGGWGGGGGCLRYDCPSEWKATGAGCSHLRRTGDRVKKKRGQVLRGSCVGASRRCESEAGLEQARA